MAAMSDEQKRAQLIARGVGIFALVAIVIGLSQWDAAARIIWGGLVIAIIVLALANTNKIMDLLDTLEGKQKA
jgi:hypothetical protein